MTANDLYNRSLDAVRSNKLTALQDAVREYQKCHCYHPRRVKVYNSALGISELREVSCGKCYHCTETKTNEWVTRMYAHLENFKNCYFITLTYRSFDNLDSPVSRIMLNYLKGALWHYDDKNKTQHMSWNPCVLCKDHYQKFLMRLRKNTGLTDITYFMCGEYGTKYGRPHFHMILFTNGTLTKHDIDKAWSMSLAFNKRLGVFKPTRNTHNVYQDGKLVEKRVYRFSFGRTDFNDLVSNGTITREPVLFEGRRFNAHQCFSYVVSYLYQRKFNDSRVKMAFDSLYFQHETCKHNKFNFKIENGYERVYSLREDLSSLFLEKKDVWSTDEQGVSTLVYPDNFSLFRRAFSSFVSPSRGTPIGSLFIRNHYEKYSQGVIVRPLLQQTGFVVPSYFLRKVEEGLFGLRFFSSRSQSPSYRKGNQPLFRSSLAAGIDSTLFRRMVVYVGDNRPLSVLLNSPVAFKDFGNGVRYLVRCESPGVCRVDGYRYSRSARCYQLVEQLSFDQFVDFYLRKLDVYLKRYQITYRQRLSNDEMVAAVRDMISNNIQQYEDFKIDLVEFIETENKEYFRLQNLKRNIYVS